MRLMSNASSKLSIGIVVITTMFIMTGAAGASDWVEPRTWGASEYVGYGYTTAGDNVALWQGIQQSSYGGWGPGSCGSCQARTDGYFGQVTRNYTIIWQTQMKTLVPSLTPDGVVGTQTWNAARFFYLSPSFDYGYAHYFTYNRAGIDPFAIQYNSYYTAWLTSNPFFCSDMVLIGSPHISPVWYQTCAP